MWPFKKKRKHVLIIDGVNYLEHVHCPCCGAMQKSKDYVYSTLEWRRKSWVKFCSSCYLLKEEPHFHIRCWRNKSCGGRFIMRVYKPEKLVSIEEEYEPSDEDLDEVKGRLSIVNGGKSTKG